MVVSAPDAAHRLRAAQHPGHVYLIYTAADAGRDAITTPASTSI